LISTGRRAVAHGNPETSTADELDLLPTHYYGTSGGHTIYRWTILATTQQRAVRAIP